MEMPSRKVGSGALAGAITVVVVWAAGTQGVDIPGEVGAAISTIFAFLTGYIVKDS